MNTLIPLEYYTLTYYLVMALFVLILFFQSNSRSLIDAKNLHSKKTFGFIVFLFVALFMGTRPISFEFGDMGVYAADFEKYKNGIQLKEGKDAFFNSGMQFFSHLISAQSFFFLCSILQINF